MKKFREQKLTFNYLISSLLPFVLCLFLFSSCEKDEVKPDKESEIATEETEQQENSMESMSFLEFAETDAYREVQERYYKPSSGNYEGRNGPCDGLLYAITGPIHNISAPVFIDGVGVNGVTYVMPISQIEEASGRPAGNNETENFYNLIIVKTKDVTSTYLMAYEQGSNEPKGLFYLPPDGGVPVSSGPCGGSIIIETLCCSGDHYGYSPDCCCGQQNCGENGKYENGSPGTTRTIYFPPCDGGFTDDCFGGIGGTSSESGTSTGTGQGSSSNGGPNPPRVFLEPGQKTEYYPDGTATPPEYIPFLITEPHINEEMVFELYGKSLIKILDIEEGTDAYAWLNKFLNSNAHEKIFDFLDEHTNNDVVEPKAKELANELVFFYMGNQVNGEVSEEAYEFADAAIEAFEDDGEVDFEEQIIIDSTFDNNDCLKDVYDKFKEGNSTISQYIENFVPQGSAANLTLKTDDNFQSNHQSQYWTAGAITSPPDNYMITITFNTDPNLPASAGNFPSIILAVEFMHEMIHAEMYRKLLAYAQQPNIPWTAQFINSLRNDFPGLSDYYTRWWLNLPPGQAPTSAQHQLMAQHYIDIMAQALSDYDNAQHPQSFYEALSWIGLKGTVAWNNLSPTEQAAIDTQIQNTIQNEPACN